MSYQLMAWATQQRTGSPTRKSVLLALANRANHDTGLCCPPIEKIANETELSVATVKRALVDLVEDGFITRERVRRQDGTLGVYHYQFPDASMSQPGVTLTPTATYHADTAEPGSRSSNQVELPPTSVALSAKSLDAQSPPKALLVEGRNLGHDALAEEAGIQDGSPRHREVAVALNGQRGREGIRDLLWREAQARDGEVDPEVLGDGEAWEQAVADEIHHRAAMYRSRMPDGTMLTPPALWKWWADLPSMKSSDSFKGVSVQDILEMTGGGRQ